jgi:hypothetical protein
LTGALVTPGTGVFLEYTLRSTDSATLKQIAVLGGYIFALDIDGELWRINPATGAVNPNLGTAYGPGTCAGTPTGTGCVTANNANEMTQAAGGSTRFNADQPTAGITGTNMIALGGNLWVGDGDSGFTGGNQKLVKITVDTSAVPSAGVCTTPGPPPCIGVYAESPNATANFPSGLATDGTNIYVYDTGNILYRYTQAFVQTPSVATFQGSRRGGLVQAPDGWFWSLAANGAQALKGLTSTDTTNTTTAANTPCNSTESNALQRANGLILGPDNTVLFSPRAPNSTTTRAVFCGVVY